MSSCLCCSCSIMSLEIITSEVYFHFIYLSVYFLAALSGRLLPVHGTGIGPVRKGAERVLFTFCIWMNICQKLLARQSRVIYLFLECGHYFSDNATPPLASGWETFVPPHQWRYIKRPPRAFSIFFGCSCGLWAVSDRTMVFNRHLFSATLVPSGEKKRPYITGTQFWAVSPGST